MCRNWASDDLVPPKRCSYPLSLEPAANPNPPGRLETRSDGGWVGGGLCKVWLLTVAGRVLIAEDGRETSDFVFNADDEFG